MTFQKDDGTALTTENTATYGDTIQITATASEKTANRSRLKAAPSTVDFYLGSVENGKKLNSSPISVNSNVATLEIALADAKWNVGEKKIIADFGGSTGLVDSTGTGTLTVNPATLTINGGTVTTKAWDNTANATITALTFDGVLSGESLTLDTDYKVEDAAYADATVGNNKAITTGTATLLDTTTAKNYLLTDGGLFGKGITGNITQATQVAPSVTFSFDGNNSNKLMGATDLMEYSLDGGTTWAACTTNISLTSSLSNITVTNGIQIRMKATATHFVGAVKKIDITKATTPALIPTQPDTIGGDGSIPMTSAHEYSSDNGSTWTAATGTTELAAGTYHVRVKAAGTALASDRQEITITAFIAAKEATPTATFTATSESGGTLSGLTTSQSYKYSIDGGSSWADFTGATATITSGIGTTNGVWVVSKGNGTTTIDSEAQKITVTKATKPSLSPTQPSTIGGDGSIPMTSAHEYKLKDVTTWTAATTSLAAGTYHVRVKAAGTALASDAQAITLTAFIAAKEATPTATFTATGADSGTLSSLTTGQSYKYSINGGSNWTDFTGDTVTIASGIGTTNGVWVVSKGNGTTSLDSEAQKITVTKAATPVLSPTQPSTIGGDGSTPMTSVHEYSSNNGSTWTAATGTTNLAAGTYHVRVKAAGTALASDRQEITITTFVGTQEATPNATFTATSESGGTLASVTTAMKYSVDGGINWINITSTSMEITDVTTTHGVKIKQPGNTTTTTDSDVQAITVTQGAAVTGVSATSCTNSSNNDGKLTGVTAAMEYKPSTASSWTNGTGNDITGLENGSYSVRVKATDTALSGNSSNYTIAAYSVTPTYGVSLSQIGTYTFAGATAGYVEQSPLTVTVSNTGNQATGEMTVALSSTNSGSFTLSKTTINSLSAAGSDSFTIVPKTGLDAGTYTAIITVSGNNSISASFNVSFTVNSGGGGGTGGGDGGSSSTTTTPPKDTTSPTNGNVTPPVTVDRNGNATTKIPDDKVQEAIQKAVEQAQKDGTTANGIVISVTLDVKSTANSLTAALSRPTLDRLIEAKVENLALTSGFVNLRFDLEALKQMRSQSTGEVAIKVVRQDVKKLSTAAQTAIGNRPAMEITASWQNNGKVANITNFGKGSIAVGIPYTKTATEQTGYLYGVYVDSKGAVTYITNSSFDTGSKMLILTTNHLSVYGVGYKAPTTVFTDIAKHWAKNDIDFVAARGLLSGTGKTTFSPDTSMTRGMFVTALGRLAGVDTKKYSNTKFTDVKADAYYSPYVAWASVNNIVNGTTATTFSPDQSITRQEMAVMLVNYSKAIGYKLPSVHAQVTFTDSASIGTWAADAVKQMQMAGILTGKSGNKFDPTATATRAEVSAMLRRYVELLVSSETAEGWAMNESGQWMYIENGKRVTGKKTVDGKAYEFDQYGVTTALPPERKYGVHTVQKGESFWSIAWKYKVSMFELTAANGKSIFSIIYAGDELKIPQK